jgi:hypothetical protein
LAFDSADSFAWFSNAPNRASSSTSSRNREELPTGFGVSTAVRIVEATIDGPLAHARQLRGVPNGRAGSQGQQWRVVALHVECAVGCAIICHFPPAFRFGVSLVVEG